MIILLSDQEPSTEVSKFAFNDLGCVWPLRRTEASTNSRQEDNDRALQGMVIKEGSE